jgi:DNA repair protein RecN (Recombination protein N)
MLCNLVVENYALISKLEIEFQKGLTIITGETGAGKSILLGALSLILGKRADTSVLYDKEKKCIVEGTFNLSQYGLGGFFTQSEIDYDDQTIIRREIAASGKSRAFINDIPVNLELLTELGMRLIDVHSQHQNLNLADSLFQMKVLDSFAQTKTILEQYKDQYTLYRGIQKRYQYLCDEAARSKSDLDYMQFQYTQLAESHLIEGEQEELELELETLEHLEEIKTGLLNSTTLLQNEGSSILQQLKECQAQIGKISKYLQGHEDLAERLNSSYIEIKDVAHEIELVNNQLTYDPDRLNQVKDRLNLLYTLEKKHRVPGVTELIALRNQLGDRITTINSFESDLELLNNQLKESVAVLYKLSSALSEQRRTACSAFETRIIEMLHEVGIPNAGFSISLENVKDYTPNGSDQIQFLFSANKNMALQNIARVASGGEISRLMLCIKSLMSDSSGLPTIIFDEIDTGVSGEIAERVGNIIHRMSDKMQIINITHLPQVASKGKHHYLVYKTDEEKTTVTRMKLLNPDERHVEIAKMLSGEQITPAALENARALLGR